MVRGRTTARGVRRGGAAASSRPQTDADDSNHSQDQPSTGSAAPQATMGLADSGAEQGASSQPAASTVRRGATSARAARAAASTGRFRPKNVRRDESERDALAQQEQQKASEREADERRARGRSRFRSKRSRGDAMGSRGGAFGRPVAGASGPFSSGMGGPGGPAGGGWFGAGGGGGGGGGSFARSGKFEAKSGSGYGFSGEGGFRESRINADKLHAMAHDGDLDSEDEAMLNALHSRTGSVMPMGILRREHKEAPVMVATAAELEAAEKANANATGEEESLWVDGEGSLPPVDQPEEGDWKRAARVKKEPTDDSMDLDVDTKPATDEKKPPLTKAKAKKPVAQDPEEKMIRTDLSLLASELGAITINGDGEEKADETANKDGRLYLFQFPPLLPPLKQVAAPQPRIKVKEEEEQQHASASLHATPLSGAATPVDLTQQGDGEESSSSDDEEDEEQERRHGFRTQALSNGGLIGRLNVRRSGKVELDWGGRILEMSPAAGMNFLTTAVIVEESDEKPQNGVTTGESIGMGKIMGRFVLAPIWSEEEEWEVAPEELDIGGASQ